MRMTMSKAEGVKSTKVLEYQMLNEPLLVKNFQRQKLIYNIFVQVADDMNIVYEHSINSITTDLIEELSKSNSSDQEILSSFEQTNQQ